MPGEQTVERVVDLGSGELARPQPRSRADLLQDDAGDITLNVVEADLREVVRIVLEEGLNASYVIDPSISGTVTLRTSRPVPARDLLSILDSVLRMNGAALVEERGIYKILPAELALGSGVTPNVGQVDGAGSPGFGIQIIPLRFVAAPEIAALLEPFRPPSGAMVADPVRNLLILAGPFEQLSGLSDLVATFDVDRLEGMSFGLFPITTAKVSEIVDELQAVFGAAGDEQLPAAVRFVPIDRLNAVLAISPEPGDLARIETWIGRLDRIGEGEDEQVFVYHVQNGRAADLAQVLSQLFDVHAGAVGGTSPVLAPGLDPVELGSAGAFGARPGEPDAVGERQDAFDSERVPTPQETGSFLGTYGASPFEPPFAAGRGEQLGAGTRIVADESTNALVVLSNRRDYRKIESTLRQLDVLPLQVMIEATIAEVTLRDELRYGIEWFFRFGDQEAVLSDLGSGVVDSTFPGFSAIFQNANDIRVVIDALERATDVDIVSSPQLLVLDNQTAQLEVGDEVPIATQTSVSTIDDDARIVNEVELRQTGVIMAVTPRVNASGIVVMEIEQEASDVVATTSSGIDSPTISQRRIGSTVAVRSGETVALGGLIQNDVEQNRDGLPFLARLPILGPLFGATRNTAERTELLVMITPRIIRNPDDAQALSRELRNRLEGLDFDVAR